MTEKAYKVVFLCMATVVLFCGIWQANVPYLATMTRVGDSGIELPVPMYHHVLPEGSKLLGAYAITPQELESDLQWIRDNGYNTVLPSEVEQFVNGEGELPQNPIMLSFDDGYESFYAYAYPLLEQYGMKAVVSVIGYYSDLFSESEEKHINYSHLTWNEMREMTESGLIEVGNHTYYMHQIDGRKGSARVRGEKDEEYREVLTQDLTKLQTRVEEELGVVPILFAYPFGAVGKGEPEMVAGMGFKMTLSCEEGVSHIIADDSNSLFMLKRYNREHGMTTEKYYQKATGIK